MPFAKHIFICTHERDGKKSSCAPKSEAVCQWFKERVKALGLKGRVRANASGCMDHCEEGPVVVVYPEGVWYRVQKEEEVEEIMQKHIVNGKIVRRLELSGEKP